MERVPLDLRQVLRVRRLYSLHYFQFASGYIFPGERHNFWEMVYIDKGEADIGAGGQLYRLGSGQVIFHKPGEFHSIWASSAAAPNIVVISFAAASPSMRHFRGFTCTLDAPQRRLLGSLLDEARLCFGQALDANPVLLPLEGAPIGAQQLISNYLEALLIQLLRQAGEGAPRAHDARLAEGRPMQDAIDRATALMRSHPDGSLSFDAICQASGLSGTALKRLFAAQGAGGVMGIYRRLRLEEARRLLRAGTMNISQTAELLGYSSVHAFSRQFRREMGLTPSEYLQAVRNW